MSGIPNPTSFVIEPKIFTKILSSCITLHNSCIYTSAPSALSDNFVSPRRPGSGSVVKGTVEYRNSRRSRLHASAEPPVGTGGAACEDMPRKSLDISFTDHPLVPERSPCSFPASGEDGSGQRPGKGSRDWSLAGSQGSALSPRRASPFQ